MVDSPAGTGGTMLAFYTVMVGNKQVASRHLPVAHAREKRSEAPGAEAREEVRRTSETRLQAAVVKPARRDEVDPYADVPCTD